MKSRPEHFRAAFFETSFTLPRNVDKGGDLI